MRPLRMHLVPQHQTLQTLGQLCRLSSCGPWRATRTLPGPISIHWPSLWLKCVLEGSGRLGWAAGVWHRVCMCVCACAHLCSPPCHAQHPTLPAADQEVRGDLVTKCSDPGLLWADSLCLPRRGLDVLMRTGAQHRGWSACNRRQPLPYSETTLQEVKGAAAHPQLWALGRGCGLWTETETNVDERKRGCPARPDV